MLYAISYMMTSNVGNERKMFEEWLKRLFPGAGIFSYPDEAADEEAQNPDNWCFEVFVASAERITIEGMKRVTQGFRVDFLDYLEADLANTNTADAHAMLNRWERFENNFSRYEITEWKTKPDRPARRK